MLQQPVPHRGVARQEGPAAAKGLPEGAADQADLPNPVAQAPAPVAEDPQAVGFIQQQRGPMVGAELGHGGHIGRAALHGEQAFAEHQQPALGCVAPGPHEQRLQVRQVVVLEAPQFGATGLDAHQQRVVNQPIGEHPGVTVRQGLDGGDVGLKSTRVEQHPLAPEPVAEGLLQLRVDRPCAADEAGGPGSHADGFDGGAGGPLQGGIAAQPQVVVAGQIQQGTLLSREAGLPRWHKAAEAAAPGGGQRLQVSGQGCQWIGCVHRPSSALG